jgi:hypothetical protein
MDINELESFNMADAVAFHEELNPKLWENEKLDPEVRDQLLLIAEDFVEYLGISNLKVRDVTLSGSNAAYSYTPHSDLDLHVLVDFNELPNNEVYQELFTAKKTLYNDAHDITVRDVPVELYVQDTNNPVQSLGEYSIVQDKWIRIPKKRRANFDQAATKLKYEKLGELIELAIKSKDPKRVNDTIALVKRYRKSGLDKAGEFGPENLAYKAVRKQGLVQALHDLKAELHGEKLSIDESEKDKIILSTDPNWYGAEVGDYKASGPVVNISAAKLVGFEPDEKMSQPKSKANVKKIVAGLKKGDKLPPILVRKYKDGYQVVDGHHRFWAYKLLGVKSIPSQIVPDSDIEEKGKKEVSETADKQAAVLKIQKHLNKKYGANLDLDGKLGPLTLKSINKFMPRAKTGLADEPNKTTAVQGKKLKEASDYSQYENKIENFVQSLNPDDVGVEQIGPYHVHFEGFTDECQQDAERRCNLPSDNPRHLANYDDVYKEVIRDFVRREGGKKPLKVGFAGYQDYPVIYAVFDNPEPYKNPDAWNPKIDETVDAHTIYSDVQSGHREPDDFIDGDIGDRIYWFDDYKLTSLPLSNLNLDEHYVDEDLVDDYIEHIKDSPKTMPPIVYDPIAKSIIDGIHRANAYANLGYDTIPAYVGLTKSSSYGEREGDNDLYEASGYIPSAKEKNDPRFKTALTVDVKPDAIKKNAKAFGFKTSRAGIPPQARADGKIAEDLMREFKTFLGEQQEEMFPGYDEQHREKRLGNWLAKSWGVQNGKPQTFYHATTKDFDTFNTSGTGFASALGMAYEVERHGSFFAVDPKFAEGFIEDPNTGRVKEGGRVLPVHLSIQSPIDLRDDALSRMLSDEETVDEFKANDIDLRSIYNHMYELERWELFDGPEGAEFIDNLQKLGFDGAIINESIPNDSNAKSGQVWVAFNPRQVKSVYNRGSFSPDDARLTKESG